MNDKFISCTSTRVLKVDDVIVISCALGLLAGLICCFYISLASRQSRDQGRADFHGSSSRSARPFRDDDDDDDVSLPIHRDRERKDH